MMENLLEFLSLFSLISGGLAGGNCTDGSTILPLVIGSTWEVSNGIWALAGCPPGYYLSFEQCYPCPALFYCTGGVLPSTPCASDQYSMPRARSEGGCFAAVFVFVVINVPISRPDFLGPTESLCQDAIARATGRSPDYVNLDIIQAGDNPRTTTVTSRVATFNAKEAAELFQDLNSSIVQAAFTSIGLSSPTLISVQVTSCVPGYELVTSQICVLCPSNYFCPGGSSGRQSCPAGSFAAPGAKNASFCTPAVFVAVTATLPISQNNFTNFLQLKFQAAMSVTAGVSLDRVALPVVDETESRRSADSQLLVTSEIAAENIASAQSISQKVNLNSLNSNLMLQGLPECSSLTVTVANSGVLPSSGTVFLAPVLEGSVGGFVLLMAGAVAIYLLLKRLKRNFAHKAFLAAVRNAKAGQAASAQHLPPDDDKESLGLRTHYSVEVVLGKGASGSIVVGARKNTKSDAHHDQDDNVTKQLAGTVAIKIVVPSKGTFDEAEMDMLKREAELLQFATRKRCKALVQAAESGVLPHRHDVCWFIMEALGPSAAVSKPSGEAACMQLVRDVLAALKVLHDEGWVHGDVTPANVVRCATSKDGFEFKLIDLGSALRIDDTQSGYCQSVTGEPAYRAPEMFRQPCVVTVTADIWSLGVTLFELVAGCLPFRSSSHLVTHWAAAIAGDAEKRAPDVRECLADGRSVDLNLVKVIAKALEKDRASR